MASVTNTDYDSNGASQSTYTFTCGIGSGDGTRTLFFLVEVRRTAGNDVTISSVTADGAACTEVIQVTTNSPSNGSQVVGIFKISAADITSPTGTSTSVVVTPSAGGRRAGCATYVTTDSIASTATDTATASDGSAPSPPKTFDVSLDTPANGFVLAIVGATQLTGSGGGWDWTGLTEDLDSAAIDPTIISTASASSVSAETPRSVTVATNGAWPSAVVAGGVVAASFAPQAASSAAASSDGVGVATATGAALAAAAATSDGVSVNIADGAVTANTVANTAGSAVATAVGIQLLQAVASSAGVGTATAAGSSVTGLTSADALASGTSTATAVGRSSVSAVALAAGAGAAFAVGAGGIDIGSLPNPPLGRGGLGGSWPIGADEWPGVRQQRRRKRKRKTHLIRIGEWPEEAPPAAQAMSIRPEEADRQVDVDQLFAAMPDHNIDEEEAALMAILALAA